MYVDVVVLSRGFHLGHGLNLDGVSLFMYTS